MKFVLIISDDKSFKSPPASQFVFDHFPDFVDFLNIEDRFLSRVQMVGFKQFLDHAEMRLRLETENFTIPGYYVTWMCDGLQLFNGSPVYFCVKTRT